MEVLALGVGAYLANALVNPGPQPALLETREQEDAHMLENPYKFNLHEMRENGAWLPGTAPYRGRMPWDENFPPYYVAATAPGGPNDDPVERAYHCLANAQEHRRLEIGEEYTNARITWARKRSGAIWQAFTEEITLPDKDPNVPLRTTNHVGFQWMPPTPTDSDWNEAALMAQALPPDPVLYTPDAYFFTAPGQQFRYGAEQTY